MVADDSTPLTAQAGAGRSLARVRAAQLRARATKQAIIEVLLGSIFLVGALAHARSPDRHSQSSLGWMAGLLVLSTLDVAIGMRTIARLRLRRSSARLWLAGTAAWGLLATALVAFLVRG